MTPPNFPLSLFFAKCIEAGRFGGKGSPTHAAAVVGDPVRDSLKDTAGPSLYVLIKLLSTLSIVFIQRSMIYCS